jgi:cyclomaltodextrinase / maltogenic alpha-amylase / neopullulanase
MMQTAFFSKLQWCCLVLTAIGFLTGASPAPVIRLASNGGDAWTFEKSIVGETDVNACDQVVIRTPQGSLRALLQRRIFRANVPLHPGRNEVRAVCLRDGKEVARTAPQLWNMRLHDGPKAWIRARGSSAGFSLDAGRSERGSSRPATIAEYHWQDCGSGADPLRLASDQHSFRQTSVRGRRLELRPPRREGEYCIQLRATDTLGRSDTSRALLRFAHGELSEIDPDQEHAAWIDSAVIYGIAPYFFGSPAFDSVSERLDEIAALGINAIWLSPVTQAAPGDFGYAVTDHLRLRNEFGDEASFRKLIARAHALGIKVLMDWVPNHFSDRHPYYRDVLRNGRRSPYYDWFDRDAQGRITHYFDWKNLMNLNYDNPEVQNYMIAAAAHWVRAFDIDGFRVDASWAVRERAPEFWPRWRAELKRINPRLLLLAEGTAQERFYARHGFDAAYDWTSQVGEWSWRDALQSEARDIDVPRLHAALAQEQSPSSERPITFHFLNNNDTGARFITRHGLANTRVAAAMLLTLPGIPLIYNGDEVGAEFEPYDEGPPIVWEDRYGLTDYYAKLIALRRESAALRSPELTLVNTDRDASVIAYLRSIPAAEDRLLVILNFSSEPVETKFELPIRASNMEAIDLLSNERVSLHESIIRLDAHRAYILRL